MEQKRPEGPNVSGEHLGERWGFCESYDLTYGDSTHCAPGDIAEQTEVSEWINGLFEGWDS